MSPPRRLPTIWKSVVGGNCMAFKKSFDCSKQADVALHPPSSRSSSPRDDELEEDVLIDQNLSNEAQETQNGIDRKCVAVVAFLSLLYSCTILHLVYFYFEEQDTATLAKVLRAYSVSVSLVEVCCIILLLFSLAFYRPIQNSFKCRLYNWKCHFYPAYFLALPFCIFGQLVLFIRRFVRVPLHPEFSPTILAIIFLSGVAFAFIVISAVFYLVRIFHKRYTLYRTNKDEQ